MIPAKVLQSLRDTSKKSRVGSILIQAILTLAPVMFLNAFQHCSAQIIEEDTIGIIEKIVERKDTMVRYRNPEALDQRWSTIREKPIDSVLFRNSSTRFKKEIYSLLFRGGSRDTMVGLSPTTNTSLAAMDGKIIRRIEFHNVNIFAPSVTDTSYLPTRGIERAVNVIHRDTRSKILQRYLLIKPGDPLDVFLTAENERVLRDITFIMDARFSARPVEGSPDSVDLVLLTQDRFPVGAELDMVKSDLVLLGVSHHNFLGFGHQLVTTTYWDAESTPQIGYRLSYGVANLGGTFTTGKLEYTKKWNQESYVIDISRDFRTASFRNAGGLLLERTDIQRNIEFLDTTMWDVKLKYTITDMWAGHMFPLANHSISMRSGLFVTGRLHNHEDRDMPEITNNYLHAFQDKTLVLLSTGFTRQGFRKDNLIYTFGRTEDVPYGYLFDLTAGYEWGPRSPRTYLSMGASFGSYFGNSAFWAGQFKFGTFINRGSMEQGAFRFQAKYFSPLYHPNQFKYRHFINFTYVHGINRIKGEYISVENQNGIVGLTSPSMRWNDKLVVNFESVLFSPYKLFGFRFAFFGSLDIGMLTSESLRMDDSRLYMGISGGVRIRNDQLVFNTFVIKLAIYPGIPDDGVAQNFVIDNLARSRFQDFFPYKPAIVDYKQ